MYQPIFPSNVGIATYTDYLISGIRKVAPEIEIRIVAEQGAVSIKKDKFEVIPSWYREEDYVEPIIKYTKGVDVIHIQHEYSIYKFDYRLPKVLQGLGRKAKKVITIHCVRSAQYSERGAVDEDFAAKIAQLADEVIVHLESQKAILVRPKFEELKNICDELLVLPYNSSGIAKLSVRLFEDQEFQKYVIDRTERYRDLTSWQAVAHQHLRLYNG